MRRCQQSLHHLAIFQVRFDDFVNILGIHIGVPNRFRVDHGDRTGAATVQTARLVHPDFAGPGQTGGFHLEFAAVKARLRLVVGTAFFAVFTLVEAKKDMPPVVGRGWGLGWFLLSVKFSFMGYFRFPPEDDSALPTRTST